MLRIRVLIGLLLLATGTSMAQSEEKGMFVYGKILELNLADSSETKVGNVLLEVFKDGEVVEEVTSSKTGKYNFFIPFGDVYEIRFGDSTFVQKILSFDLSSTGGKVAKKGYSLDLDISLFRSDDSLLIDLHSIPVAKAAYSKQEDLIVFDPSYSSQRSKAIRNRIKAVRKE